MAKIAALGAYFYQAALAFGLLIAVSNILPASEYAAYSLFVSIVQFAAIACFEWVRFACSRFYPGPDRQSEAVERGVIVAEFLASSVVCAAGAGIALGFGATLPIALAGAAAAILQGGGELHLTMLRFRQEFRLFSWLQGARASILAIATLAGAAAGRDFHHVVMGLLVGNLAYGAVAWLASRRILRLAPRWNRVVARRHAAYGSVSAGASVAGMLAPLGLKAILASALGPAGAAAPMLALDLLQRPFVLIVSSLQAIRYPDLVSLFDRAGDSPAMRDELGRYYAALACFSLIGAAGLMALLEPATRFAVPAEMQTAFLRTAPPIMIMALLRALTQTLLPTPAHLRRDLPAIAWLAADDCFATCAGAFVAMQIFAGSDLAIVTGGAVGAGAAVIGGSVLLRGAAFELPRGLVALSGLALIASWAGVTWLGGNPLLATTGALAATLLLGGLPCLKLLRWIAR